MLWGVNLSGVKFRIILNSHFVYSVRQSRPHYSYGNGCTAIKSTACGAAVKFWCIVCGSFNDKGRHQAVWRCCCFCFNWSAQKCVDVENFDSPSSRNSVNKIRKVSRGRSAIGCDRQHVEICESEISVRIESRIESADSRLQLQC